MPAAVANPPMPCRPVCALCLVVLCGACGQTGPLYLPEPAAPRKEIAPPAPDDHRPAPSTPSPLPLPQTPDEDQDAGEPEGDE